MRCRGVGGEQIHRRQPAAVDKLRFSSGHLRHPHDVELSIKMEAAFPTGQPHGPLPQRQVPPWLDYLGHQFL